MRILLFIDQTDFTSSFSYSALVNHLTQNGVCLSRFYSAVIAAVGILARTNGYPTLITTSLRAVMPYDQFTPETRALVTSEFNRLLSIIQQQVLSFNYVVREDNYTLCFHKYNHRDIQVLAFRMNSLANIL